MDQFEILGSSGAAPEEAPSETSTGGPRWILLVPVLAVVALLAVLTQGGDGPGSEEASPVTVAEADDEALTPTTRPEVGTEDAPTTSLEGPPPLTDDAVVELLASFDDRVILASGQGGVLQVQRVSETEARPLDIEGTPLAIAENWLVLGRDDGVWVLDMADADSSEIELAIDGISIDLAETSADVVLLTGFDREEDRLRTVGFEIGEWGAPILEVDFWPDFSIPGAGFRSPLGSGVFELTALGYQRRGGGQTIAYSDDFVVIEECEVDPLECAVVMRDRSTWRQLTVFADQIGANFSQVSISSDGPVAYVSNPFFESEQFVIELMTGAVVPTDGDTFGWGQQLQVNSNDRGLIVSDISLDESRGSVSVIDRATGFEVVVGARSGIIVPADLPRLAARGG